MEKFQNKNGNQALKEDIILSKKSKEWEKFRVLISSSVTTLH